MNVAIVDGDVSYPATSGKRLRTLHLMLRLAGRHRITYVARASGDADEARAARDFLGDHGIGTVLVDDPVARKQGLAFYARLAANLFSPLPYSAASHRSAAMSRAVCGHAAGNKVDLWQFEWSPYLATLADHSARRLLVAHNVDSLIWQRYYETETNTLKRLYIRNQWRKFERFEGRAFREATRVVAVSPEDAALVRGRFGVDAVDVVDNGVDAAHFAQTRREPAAGRVLFLGSLEWRPNLDAVRLLLDVVFPAVRAAEPGAELAVVGRNPPAWLADRVKEAPGAMLHANVADVRPFLGSSTVLAVPLRIGGGSRLKILEALACGLPVVSTRVGAEGLSLRPREEFTQVERVEDMAAALLACLRDPAAARVQAEHGRRVVRERYDWGVLADKLERVWEKCVTSKPLAA